MFGPAHLIHRLVHERGQVSRIVYDLVPRPGTRITVEFQNAWHISIAMASTSLPSSSVIPNQTPSKL
jgi:hypothetical protein